MKIVFMGTPDFAVPVLEAICNDGHEVAAVVTQPDKPKGRGGQMQFSPVKQCANEKNIKVYQPERVRNEEFVDILKEICPDVIVVVAFGQILSKDILDIPQFGCINVHASLLPKYRGAAPIQWAIIDGEKETGVTTMQMDEGLDTGDILIKKVLTIEEKETGGSLFDKLSQMGGDIIIETLNAVEAGTLKPEKQNDENSNYAKMLDKKTGKLDFSEKTAVEIERLIRGLNPWPSAYTSFRNKTLKIWDADVVDESAQGTPGEIVNVTKDEIHVMTKKGILVLNELQLEGKKRMDTLSFLRGYQVNIGDKLGD